MTPFSQLSSKSITNSHRVPLLELVRVRPQVSLASPVLLDSLVDEVVGFIPPEVR